MIDQDFAAYVEGLPPQDRRTVEQALRGLRSALRVGPQREPEAARREVDGLIVRVTKALRGRRGPA